MTKAKRKTRARNSKPDIKQFMLKTKRSKKNAMNDNFKETLNDNYKETLNDSLLNNTVNSFKTFGTSAFWKNAGYVSVGALSYVLSPTLLESVFKTDTTGWKMPITGITTALIISGITKKPEILYGAIGTFVAQWMYAKGNGAIVEPIFGQSLARFDAQAIYSMSDNNIQSLQPAPPTTELVQPGAYLKELQLPDGSRTVSAYPTINDNFITQLNDNFMPTLSAGGYEYSLKDDDGLLMYEDIESEDYADMFDY